MYENKGISADIPKKSACKGAVIKGKGYAIKSNKGMAADIPTQ